MNNTINTTYLWSRYLIELPIAIISALILSPLIVYIAIRIVTESDGPALLRKQFRVRKGGKFFMYKFRTMHSDYENLTPSKDFKDNMHKDKDDKRVTNFGKFLRKTDLDELPQLLNVIRGEMSFIGPRPFTPEEEAYYKKKHPELRTLINSRKKIKPGLTGLWQTSGRNETTLKERLLLDVAYMTKANPLLDADIVLTTIKNILDGIK